MNAVTLSFHHLSVAAATQTTKRFKHSSTQIKRIFRRNPARLRILKREAADPNSVASLVLAADPAIPEPQFTPIFQPNLLKNGWSKPPGPEVEVPEYPFSISRTGKKANGAPGFLPVYSKFRKDGTKVTTEIRKISGDRESFIRELRATLQLPSNYHNHAVDPVKIRAGSIEVKGNHVRHLKTWLASLGF